MAFLPPPSRAVSWDAFGACGETPARKSSLRKEADGQMVEALESKEGDREGTEGIGHPRPQQPGCGFWKGATSPAVSWRGLLPLDPPGPTGAEHLGNPSLGTARVGSACTSMPDREEEGGREGGGQG